MFSFSPEKRSPSPDNTAKIEQINELKLKIDKNKLIDNLNNYNVRWNIEDEVDVRAGSVILLYEAASKEKTSAEYRHVFREYLKVNKSEDGKLEYSFFSRNLSGIDGTDYERTTPLGYFDTPGVIPEVHQFNETEDRDNYFTVLEKK